MCCFSQPVDLVRGTHIFARASEDGRQFLVYSMTLVAKTELAMILPLPTPKESKEKAVRFINLEKYEDFFKDLAKGFPEPRGGGNTLGLPGNKAHNKLEVVEVGSYEASFVPSVGDFSRLDERFRLPEGVWDKLPQYKDHGFAVFKLKKGASNVHPMAFELPRAKPKQLFFPTVHIHDGKVHDTATFDHALYCQVSGGEDLKMRWTESTRPAGMFMKIDKAKGLLDPEAHVYRRKIVGRQKNQDIVV